MRTVQATAVMGLLLLSALGIASGQDVYSVLSKYPQYSKMNELLNMTNVAMEINTRSSLTIFLVEDGILNGYVGSHPSYTTQMVADVLRYHVLLQYFSPEDLMAIVAPQVVTTLYQTTGRANDLDGFVNITAKAGTLGTVGPSTPGATMEANIITNVTQYPYNYTFYSISAVLEPLGLAAAQLAPTTPPTPAPVPVPAPVTAPTMAPTMTPTTAPVEAPTMAPVEAPTMAPVETPMLTPPVEAPVTETPTSAPIMTPPVTAPVAAGPVAEGPMAPASSAFAVEFNFAAVVASVLVAAFLL